MALFLHIGANKCGSSALQTALTKDPHIVREDGSIVEYAAINLESDSLLKGGRLAELAGVYKYKISPVANNILDAPLKGVERSIKEHSSDLILSNESWLLQPRQWASILERLDVEANVVIYVRPQVPVLNSAWWQWGAWSDQTFDDWMERQLQASMWGASISRWARIPKIGKLIVRPVIGDVVKDFYLKVIGAKPPVSIERPNPSLSGAILRLFQRNRSLRPTPHASRIDFALSSIIPMNDPSIWVMDRNWMDRVISETRLDNELLMSFMSEDDAKAVRDDQRWWSLDAYSDKVAESPLPKPIPNDKLEEMCVQMINAIYKMKRG